jgi:hypothetical protein
VQRNRVDELDAVPTLDEPFGVAADAAADVGDRRPWLDVTEQDLLRALELDRPGARSRR